MVLDQCIQCGNAGMPFEMGGPILSHPKGFVHWGCLTEKEQAKAPKGVREKLIERGFAVPEG